MPWSQWQDPVVKQLTPSRIVIRWDTVNGNYTEQAGTNALYTATDNIPAGGTQKSQSGFQFQASANWPTYRDWNPQGLWPLTEGVDYGVIPGKGEYDDDRFVDYDDVDNTFAGWDFPAAQTASFTIFEPPGATLSAVIGITPGTSYPMTPSTPLSGPFPGVGAAYGSWSQATPAGSPLPVTPDPGQVETFSILIDVTTDGSVAAQASYVQPKQRVVLPRWRYWIPETAKPKPLRQRQRDDGLGMSTRRGRGGTSRQASIRQRTYL